MAFKFALKAYRNHTSRGPDCQYSDTPSRCALNQRGTSRKESSRVSATSGKSRIKAVDRAGDTKALSVSTLTVTRIPPFLGVFAVAH